MPSQLPENSRVILFENGLRKPSLLRFELTEGVSVWAEFETAEGNSVKNYGPPKYIECSIQLIFEKISWANGQLGFDGLETTESGPDEGSTSFTSRTFRIGYHNEKDRDNAVDRANEWIEERHREIYDRYVSRRTMIAFIK